MKISLLLATLIVFTTMSFANDHTWRCSASDDQGLVWQVNKKYRRLALNLAKQHCLKQSTQPSTCRVAEAWCDFITGERTYSERWRCTALDHQGREWPGGYYSSRESAQNSAKDICNRYSSVPKSCYTRPMLCNYSGS